MALFGKRPTFGNDYQDPVDPGMTMAGMGIITAPDVAPAPKKSGLWGKVADIAGSLSEGILNAYGQQGAYGRQMEAQRAQEQQMRQAEAKAKMDAVARQAAAQQEVALYDYKRANPMPSQPYRFQDNAGNVWTTDETGKPQLMFVDRAPKQQMVSDGERVTFVPIPNPYAQQGGEQQQAPSFGPRPANMTDDQLLKMAHESVRNGANVEQVFRRLQAWGVNP